MQREQWQRHLPQVTRLPSESTIRRTLRQVDVAALERGLAAVTLTQLARATTLSGCVISSPGEIWQGQAVDGKTVRGASAHGARTHLVSLVQHGTGATLAQHKVAEKRNEITAVPVLLASYDLTGSVTTMDALLTQRTLAQQIIDQGGQYLMIVKRNQGRLYEDLELFLRLPAVPADQERWDRVQQSTKGHGRLETRTLECSTGLVEYVGWPGSAQVVRRTCERVTLKSGKQSVEVSYGITSLSPDEAGALELEALWRGHWTIENRKHYVRDVTMGEDANQMHTGAAPQVLAALRNGLIDLWRQHGWRPLLPPYVRVMRPFNTLSP